MNVGDSYSPTTTVEHRDSNGKLISRYLAGETYRVTPRNLEFLLGLGNTSPEPKGTAVKSGPGKIKAAVAVKPKKDKT